MNRTAPTQTNAEPSKLILPDFPKPYYHDEKAGIVIYHGDCQEIPPLMPKVDLVLTDPQYGIGFDVTTKRSRRSGLKWGSGRSEFEHDPNWIPLQNNDEVPFDPPIFIIGSSAILWGANNYSSKLPDSRGWIVWDKLGNKNPCCFGDCELAWTNLNTSIRIHRQLWRGLVREGKENVANMPKFHPCQKPEALMRFCILHADRTVKVNHNLILDPFMGSGTTLVAAKKSGAQGDRDRDRGEVLCHRRGPPTPGSAEV